MYTVYFSVLGGTIQYIIVLTNFHSLFTTGASFWLGPFCVDVACSHVWLMCPRSECVYLCVSVDGGLSHLLCVDL